MPTTEETDGRLLSRLDERTARLELKFDDGLRSIGMKLDAFIQDVRDTFGDHDKRLLDHETRIRQDHDNLVKYMAFLTLGVAILLFVAPFFQPFVTHIVTRP